MPRLRATSLDISNPRRGLIPGGSEQFKRYKILRRQQSRAQSLSVRGRRVDDEDSSNSDHSLDLDPDAEMEKVVNLCRVYATELYLPLQEKHPTNFVYSPLGYCLSSILLLKSCVGPSKHELSQALFSNLEMQTPSSGGGAQGDANATNSDEICSEVTIGLTALLESIQENEDSYVYKHAYKLYLDSRHKPRFSYLNKVKAIHPGQIELENVDFSSDNWNECTGKINQWAHVAGQKMLGEMVTKRSANTKMIFVNPVYFMGNWVHPFNPALTKEMRFFVSDKEFVNVPTMQSGILKNLLFAPINKLACRALVLPYKGDHLCLVIFLPNDKVGLSVIEAALESIVPSTYFQEMHNFRKKRTVNAGFQVFLPSFKIDCTIDLQGPMKELGVDSIFQAGKADFSGLSRVAPKDLCVTQILQKVVIDVNELGSAKLPKRFKEAQQHAVKTRATNASQDEDVIEFRVDHPFYFQVVDMKSDLIVIAGTCRNPLHGKDLGIQEFLDKYDIEVAPKPLTVSGGEIKSWGARNK